MENVLKMYKQQLDEIILEAEKDGVVLTIELVPNQPLAMGNNHMASSVREARKLAPIKLEPPFLISKSSIDEFRKRSKVTDPALRVGQAFHQYFKLEKITNPEAKAFADRIYNARMPETKDLIDYITDWSN